MTGTTGAAQQTNPNRERHDYSPIKGAQIYYRRAHPRAPVELVVSYGGQAAIVYELTPEQLAAHARDTNAMFFTSVVEIANGAWEKMWAQPFYRPELT